METDIEQSASIAPQEKHPVFQITTLSKYLAVIFFILLPFIGGWIGYTYAPVKIVEVEKVVTVHDAQKTTEQKVSFVVGQTLDFIGTVRIIDQYCEEPGFCRNYASVLLPDTQKSDRIFEARIEGDGCIDSSIRVGDMVKVSGKIFYVDDEIGLTMYCEQGVILEKVLIANAGTKESSGQRSFMANVLAVVDGSSGLSLVLDQVERNPDFYAGYSENDGVYRGFFLNGSDVTEITLVSPSIVFTHCGAEVKTNTEELHALSLKAASKQAPWSEKYVGAVYNITTVDNLATRIESVCVP